MRKRQRKKWVKGVWRQIAEHLHALPHAMHGTAILSDIVTEQIASAAARHNEAGRLDADRE